MWATTVASQLGSFIQIVATSWTMTALTASAAMVALVQTAANLPVMLFAIASGALADMFDKRSVMLVAQLLMFALSLALALCAALDMLTPGLLLGFTFLIGCGTALHQPSWQASVGDLVPRGEIPSAVATNIFGNNVARSIGPVVGGTIVSLAGASVAFVVNAISYVGIIGVLFRWEGDARPERSRPRFLSTLGGGFRYVLSHAPVRNLVLRTLAFSLGAAGLWGLMPLVAVRLGGGAELLGILFGCFGIGAMGGAMLSIVVRARRGSETVLRWGVAAVAVATCLLGLTRSVPLAVLAHLVAGAGWVSALSTFNVSVQLAVERGFVGRVLAIYQTTAFGGIALGAVFWGVIADAIGVPATLAVSGLSLAVSGIIGAAFALPAPIEHGA